MTTVETTLVDPIAELEIQMLQGPQIDLPVTHHFAPGVYVREGVLKAGNLIMGHAHKEAGISVIFKGKALLRMGDVTREITGPCMFRSEAGVRKTLYIIEDLHMCNIHGNPDNETDMAVLTQRYVAPSAGFLQHKALTEGPR